MSDTFKDWIPEGQDTGAIGDGGYQDFVPAPEPKPQVVQEIIQPEPVVEPEVKPVVEQPIEQPVPSEPIVPPLEGGSQ